MRAKLSLVTATLCGCLVFAASASAAVTHSTVAVTSPTGTYLIDDLVTPNESITVSGTTDGSTGDNVDINCYAGSPNPTLKHLFLSIPVQADGSFSHTGPMSSIAKETCVLRAVPAGDTTAYTPGSAWPYTGPTLAIGQVYNDTAFPGGPPSGYLVYDSQLRGAFDYASLGDCAIDDSYVYDPVTLSRSTLDYCNAWFWNENADSSNSPTRSELQIDGADAYLPGNAKNINSVDLSHNPGYPSLTYSYSIDPATGNLVLDETDEVVKCSPGGVYPPTSASCSSFVPTGVQVRLHITQGLAGRVATVVQYFSSTDGRSHTVDMLQDNEFKHVNNDGQLNFPWTGAGLQPYTTAGQALAGPSTSGPGSFFVKGSASVPDGGEVSPQGSVTYSNPPSGVTIVDPTNQTSSWIQLQYSRTVPASGSVALGFTYGNAFLASEVAGYATAAEAAFRPSVAITSPAAGAHSSRQSVTVVGTVADATGVSSVSVNGRLAQVGAGGAWSATVSLRPGANTVTATVTNVFGNTAQAQVSLTAAPALTGLSQAHRVWREHRRAGRIPVGTTFRFALDSAARATFAFSAQLQGRRSGARCVAPGRGRSHKRHCVRTVVVGTMSVNAKAGRDSVKFAGRVNGRRLKPGRYAVLITATAAGVSAPPQRLTFTIVP